MASNGTVLLSTKSFPPVIGGSAFLLFELLRHFPEDYFSVVHGVNDPLDQESALRLPFKRKQVLFINRINTPRAVRYVPEIYSRLIRYHLQKEINKGNIRRIYAHYPNGVFLVSAYKTAKKNKLPLTVYFDILWEELARNKELELAETYEKEIMEYADQVFAITEFAVEYLSKKHIRKVELIPHTMDVKLLDSIREIPVLETPKIHFAGGIYDMMNTDAVLRMVNAVETSGRQIELEFCSPDLPHELVDKGYKNKYVSRDVLVELQRNSSILFLPLAFNSARPMMIRNNFPTKTMEYACSGVPILIHAPKDSYLSQIARQEGFAYVVDEEDQEALMEGINRLLEDKELQKQLTDNALRFAKSRDSKHWSAIFKSALDN